MNVVGLRLGIQSLPIAVEYMNRGHELEFKACLRQAPEIIKAGGWAFGFIPLWLVNALIPSNVEEIATNFFRAFNKQFIAAFYQDYQRVKTNRELVNINE